MSRREFQLIEGTSRKFWSIELDGQAHTVQFGRIGTDGQTQRKAFNTAAEAKRSYDKLIADKLKKGYTEVSATTTAAPKPARAKPAPKASDPNGAAPEPPPSAPTTAATLSTICSIDLDPGDWFWATWRPRTPLPRPALKPFDLEECLDRLDNVRQGPYSWNWSKVRITPTMTREEAHFWLVAITEMTRRNLMQPTLFVQELRRKKNTFEGTLSQVEAARMIRPVTHRLPEQTAVVLANLLSPRDLIALSRENQNLGLHLLQNSEQGILGGFRKAVLPYLSDEEHRAMQDELRTMLGTPGLPLKHKDGFPLEVYLAAALGLHEEVGRIVRSIPDDHYAGEDWRDYYERPQLLILGLGDPRSVVSEMRRLKLILKRPEYIRGWIAHTEDASLDDVRDSILHFDNKDDCAALLKVLALVKSAKNAGPMLDLLGSKAPGIARSWLDEQPGHAIPGLIPVAVGKGKLADAALDYLRAQKRKGHEGFIRECLASTPPDVAEKVRRRCSNAWRTRSPPSTRRLRRTGCVPLATKPGSSSLLPGSRLTTCGPSSSMAAS